MTVVGIAPRGFYGDRLSIAPPDFYFPMKQIGQLKEVDYVANPDRMWLYVIGRVKPGVDRAARVLSFEEQERYLAKATPMLRDVATLMLETGMRPEEVYRIRRENVHLEQGFLAIPYGKTKAARWRVPLTAAARSLLGHRMTCNKDFFPCETDSDRPVPKANNAHDRAVRDSKVAPFRLYDLRHTRATRAAMSGIDLVTLAAMLGHSRIQTVLRYAHPTQQHQHQAMVRLEQFVSEQRIAAAERITSVTSHAIQ